MTLRPCLTCGEPAEGPRCLEHTAEAKRTATERGYDAAWAKLSKRARRLQPWCTDCGATENLQLDHLPSAWERKAKGLRIRLGADTEVVCGPCNVKRGAARGAKPTRLAPSRASQQPPARQNLRLTPDVGRGAADQRRFRGSSL